MGFSLARHVSCSIKRSSHAATMTQFATQLALARRCLASKSGGRLTGPQLTNRVKGAASVQDLFAFHARYRADYDGILLSATWTQLSKLTRGNKGAVPKAQLGELIHDTERMAAQGELRDRGLANVAYAVARITRKPDQRTSELLDELARASAASIGKFNPQELANTAWAFATVGHASPALFEAVSRASVASIGQFTPQALANTAWAFAVADHCISGTINHHLVQAFETSNTLSSELLSQLHQWHLWKRERNFVHQLPHDFLEGCKAAFMAHQPRPSCMQRQVETTVSTLGLPFRSEVITNIGYSIDIVAEWQGAQIGIEVDGPSHFIGRDPSGATLLKRRQLRKLEGWKLCSVPYWEWREVSSDAKRRQKYVLQLLQRAFEASL